MTPRFLTESLVSRLRALDAQLEIEEFSGHFTLHVHYDRGMPRTAKVQPPEQSIRLQEADMWSPTEGE